VGPRAWQQFNRDWPYVTNTKVVLPESGALSNVPLYGYAAGLLVSAMIAIVDDDEASREALGFLTKSLGFPSEVFASAAEFLGWKRLSETACLIADINMPGMTGVELHRQLVKSGCSIPTVLVTAYPDDSVRERALADGVIAYLSKPCSESALLSCVHSALHARKLDPHR
jgi:FixJ family two-component response regulator